MEIISQEQEKYIICLLHIENGLGGIHQRKSQQNQSQNSTHNCYAKIFT